MNPADRLRAYPGLATMELRLGSFPAPQRQLWPALAEVPLDFVLYGGSALALRLDHRTSVDFDFFARRRFDPGDLVREIPLLRRGTVIQSAPDTLSVRVDGVRLSFFSVEIGAMEAPDIAFDNGVPVASLRDLAATKMKTLLDRAEAKDYLDVDAAITAGVDLPTALGDARAIFGPAFEPLLALKAITFFEEPGLRDLDDAVRARLRAAARAVSDIPRIEARYASLLPDGLPARTLPR